jgi:hypothetical protein
MKNIAQQCKGYRDLWDYIGKTTTPRYSPEQTIAEVERYLAYLARIGPTLQRWATAYLDKNRGAIWLEQGLGQYNKNTSLEELQKTWPWLYDRTPLQYHEFLLDRDAATQEKERQYARRNTKNPNYVPSPYGWLEDEEDVNEWYKEEEEERKASRNIFFNYEAREPCYEAMLPEIESVREQWEIWEPPKDPYYPPKESLPDPVGKTRAEYVMEWVRRHYYFHNSFPIYYDTADKHRCHSRAFHITWGIVDRIDERIAYHQEQLQQVKEALQQMELQPTKEPSA